MTAAMRHYEVPDDCAGQRLDRFLADCSDTLSRAQVQQAIGDGRVQVDGTRQRASYRVCVGAHVQIELPEPVPMEARPEPIPLDILYEDEAVIVVNKPAGMVVHPACGHPSGTLVNALLHHGRAAGGSADALRPGIVHRLDKDTSGVMVVARTESAHFNLGDQFHDHTVGRTYVALVYGQMPEESGRIEAPIGRDRVDRKKMSTRARRSRPALTCWQVRESYGEIDLIEATLGTGRTHQVRVHLASIGHPVVGDPVYCPPRRKRTVTHKPLHDLLVQITRQLLHAARLEFRHPVTGQLMSFEAPVPEDFARVLQLLRSRPC